MTSIRLPEEMTQRLEALAARTRRSKSFYIKEALELYLEDVADAYEALERIADPRATYMRTKDILAALKKPQ